MDDGAAGEADGGDIRLLVRQSLLAKKGSYGGTEGSREGTKDEGREGRRKGGSEVMLTYNFPMDSC